MKYFYLSEGNQYCKRVQIVYRRKAYRILECKQLFSRIKPFCTREQAILLVNGQIFLSKKKAFLCEGANYTIPSRYHIVQAAKYFVLERKPCSTKKFNQAESVAKLHVCRTIEQTIPYHKANHALQWSTPRCVREQTI